MKKYFKKKSESLFLYSPLFYGLGIGAFLLFDITINVKILIALSIILILMTLIFRRKNIFIFLFFAMFLVLGYTNIALHSSEGKSPLFRTFYRLLIEGEVEHIELYPSAQRVLLNNVSVVGIDWKWFPTKVRIKVNGLHNDISVGDKIRVRATLMPPPLPVYPRAYDFTTKAWFEGLGAVGFNTSNVEVLSNNTEKSLGEKFKIYMAEVREMISMKIRNALPINEGRVALALVTGEQSSINSNVLQDYRDTGLAHILSVSGMHMSMLAFLVFAVCRMVLSMFSRVSIYLDIKKISAVIALIISFLYLMISGFAVPAERAFIMVAVAFLAILFNRRAISLRSVAIAALLILTVSPASIISAGFQMSFAAVVMLIALYEKFYVKKGKTISSMAMIYIYGIIITAIIGTLSTAPYAIYHFNRFPLYSVIANLCVSTLFSIMILPFLLLSVVAMPFGEEALFLDIAGYGIKWMNEIASFFANIDDSVILLPQISNWILIAITVGGYLFVLSQSKWRYLYLLPIALMVIGFRTYQKPDFIINSDSSLVAIKNAENRLILSPGLGNRMERRVWLGVNAQEYNKDSRKETKKYFANLCDSKGNCNITVQDYKFSFNIDKENKNKTLKIYKNNKLYQEIGKNDLSDNKTMIFYVEKNDLIIDTVKNNKARWWK